MSNFISYMAFSFFEYCGIFLIILSLSNSKIVYYKKEFFITVFIITLVSYIVTIFNPSLTSFISVILMMLSLKYLFSEKKVRAIVVVLVGSIIYGAMQWTINHFAIGSNYITMEDTNIAFSTKSYIMQALSSIIAIAISSYLRIFNGGFGFSLRLKNRSYYVFLFTSILLFILPVLCYISFIFFKKELLFNLSGIMLIVSAVSIILLSINRDRLEYS